MTAVTVPTCPCVWPVLVLLGDGEGQANAASLVPQVVSWALVSPQNPVQSNWGSI